MSHPPPPVAQGAPVGAEAFYNPYLVDRPEHAPSAPPFDPHAAPDAQKPVPQPKQKKGIFDQISSGLNKFAKETEKKINHVAESTRVNGISYTASSIAKKAGAAIDLSLSGGWDANVRKKFKLEKSEQILQSFQAGLQLDNQGRASQLYNTHFMKSGYFIVTNNFLLFLSDVAAKFNFDSGVDSSMILPLNVVANIQPLAAGYNQAPHGILVTTADGFFFNFSGFLGGENYDNAFRLALAQWQSKFTPPQGHGNVMYPPQQQPPQASSSAAPQQ